MGYLKYDMTKISDWEPYVLIGTRAEEIQNTLTYYKTQRQRDGWGNVAIPTSADLEKIDELRIACDYPLLVIAHRLEIRVADDAVFLVNANIFDDIRKYVRDYERLKRGDLFKFENGRNMTFFLPEKVMRGLAGYNWQQHGEQVRAWNSQREDKLIWAEIDDAIVRRHNPKEN